MLISSSIIKRSIFDQFMDARIMINEWNDSYVMEEL